MGIVNRSSSAALLAALLANGPSKSDAWVVPSVFVNNHPSDRATKRMIPQRSSRGVILSMGPPKEEFLEDCDADPEGECEIDWDRMVFPDANEDSDAPQSMEQELYNLVKEGRDEVLQKSSQTDPAKARLGLEMAWQMQETQEECEVEKPESCSEMCPSCHGAGVVACRFCHGSKVLALKGMSAQSCLVCQAKGVEDCQPCRGSGWIADWTQLKLQTTG